MLKNHQARTAVVIVLVAIAISLRGVVCGGLLYYEDIAAYFEPLWTAVATSLRHGELPRWALGAWGGQPLLGDPQIGVFYPPHWILWVLCSPVRAYSIDVLLHTTWAALGMMALARTLDRSWPAAATAGVAIALSAFFVLEARHVMFLVSAAWVPWLLVAIARHAQSGSSRSLAAIAACVALAILGGGWSMLIFATPVVVVFTIGRGRVPSAALAALLGVALAAVQLVPAFAHAALSPRALPLADGFSTSYAWPSWAYAKTLLFPLAYGDDARGTYVGAPDQWELCGYGAGVVASTLAVSSVFGAVRRREQLVYLALVICALVVARGWIDVSHVPLLSHTRGPARALFIVTLVVPMLAAVGTDRLPARLRWLAPIAIALELCITFRAENRTVRDLPPPPQALRDVAAGERVLFDVHLGQRFHNGGLRWGVESESGYSSLPLWRVLHLDWIANHRAVYPGWPTPRLAHDLTAQGLWTLDSPIVDLLGVRWLLAPRDRPPAGTGWVLVQRGEDGPEPIDRWRNDEAMPRGFVVHAVDRVDSEAEAAEHMARYERTVVEEDVTATGRDIDEAELRRDGATARFHVTAHGAGLFVFAEPWTPSWRVAIDDREASVLRVDYALTGVAISDGAHDVTFTQRDRPLRLGALVSLLAAIATLALCFTPRRSPP
jgi:hypothetical protein